MSLVHEIICESVKTRDMDSLNKALHIVFPDRMENKELVVYEYDGSVPRLFGDDRHIELMLPEDMDEIVENAVVDAIENGTLFDDADHVKNAATYITMTKLPVNGMVNRGIDEPVGMKHAIGSVVGAMNSDGRFGVDEEDIENGKNFAHDIIDHGDEDNARDLVASYIDAKDHNKLPIEFRRSLKDLGKEINDVKSVKPEDSISSSDLDDGLDMKKVKEMGSIGDDGVDDVEECGCQCVKEEDGGEMEPGETPTTPTSVETEYADDIDIEEYYNFTELDELYQELDDIYASVSSYELNYFLENGEVPDQNKQSKIADTWDRIKQWFKRTFLSIVTKFKNMQIRRRLDQLEKERRAGKEFFIISNFPEYFELDDEEFAQKVDQSLQLFWDATDYFNNDVDKNSIRSAIDIMKEAVDRISQTVNKQKQVLSKPLDGVRTIYLADDHFVKIRYFVLQRESWIDEIIKKFKVWDKTNRKFNGNEYDAKAWRTLVGYVIKYLSLVVSCEQNRIKAIIPSAESKNQSQEDDDENIVDLDDQYGFEPGQVEESYVESSNENKWETLENMLGRKLPEDFKNGIDDRNDIANHFQGSVYSKYDFGIADACNVNDIIKYRKDNNNYLENDDYLHFAGDGWGNSLILMYHPKSKDYSYALWYHDQFEGDNHKTIIIGKTWKEMRSKFKNEDVKESYIDTEEIYKTYVEEGFLRRPKKLKPIPRDVVAYITVEINAIQDANDQAMLSGYTCAKLELVDFYITCLDTNDDRYIVPHTRQYLVQMQNDLNRLLTRILQLRPINKSNRMWKVNVTLPEGR